MGEKLRQRKEGKRERRELGIYEDLPGYQGTFSPGCKERMPGSL